MNPNLYEIHITYLTSQAEQLEPIAKDLHWKTSQIARDPVLGDDTYFYLTKYADSEFNSVEEINKVLNTIEVTTGILPLRVKIEHIIYDKRYHRA